MYMPIHISIHISASMSVHRLGYEVTGERKGTGTPSCAANKGLVVSSLQGLLANNIFAISFSV